MTRTIHASAKQRPAGSWRDRLREWGQAVTTPLLPEDYLDLVMPLRSGGSLRGRIEEIHPETRDAVTLCIRPSRDWRSHVPGQYVRLGVDVDGVRHWRAYSLTSPPGQPDGLVRVTVKAMPDGVVSNHLVRRATPGTLVHLDPPTGDFTLAAGQQDAESSLSTPDSTKDSATDSAVDGAADSSGDNVTGPVLFVTAGSGITPVMGMLRAHLRRPEVPQGALSDVVVVHSAPTVADVIFGGQLRRWAAQGLLRLVERHTDVDGMLDAGELDNIVGDLSARETWACGPTGLLDALEKRYADLGLLDRLHTERFRPTVVVTGEGGSINFTRSRTTVQADASQPLLDAGEASGVLMPSGCRMGICYGCVAPLRSGAVRDLRNGQLTMASDGPAGTGDLLIQTCISAAAGDCAVDL